MSNHDSTDGGLLPKYPVSAVDTLRAYSSISTLWWILSDILQNIVLKNCRRLPMFWPHWKSPTFF